MKGNAFERPPWLNSTLQQLTLQHRVFALLREFAALASKQAGATFRRGIPNTELSYSYSYPKQSDFDIYSSLVWPGSGN